MFEHMTYPKILQQMLDRVTGPVDKREGSIIWDALAPAAAELAQLYVELDVVLRETFGDTASREYLILRAAERALEPYPATHAVLRGEFDAEVPVGARFSLDVLDYRVLERMEDGSYRLECETAGTIGNRYLGDLVPMEYIDGLGVAKLTEILIPARDEEGTEAFRARYMDSFDPTAFGGNAQDYKEKVMMLDGVGGVKVFPVWNGGGTVKLALLDAEHNAPTAALIDAVQTAIDPEVNQGEGLGIAPIGHTVTVVGAQEQRVDVATRVIFEEGYNWDQLRERFETVVEDYLLELRAGWMESNQLVVRISQIETRLLALSGVLDIGDTVINGEAQNLILDSDAIPVRGDVDATAG